MTSFRTEISPKKVDFEIDHQHNILCIGSCFAENIGNKLNQLKFPVLINPFGIVYNPISIVNVLEKLISEKEFSENDLFENLGLYHSFAHHGRFSHPDKNTALNQINKSLYETRFFLDKTNRLILTLGTAHVFVYKKTNKIVANCHKVPGHEFFRKRLSVEEVASPLVKILKQLKAKQPALKIIVTVSPVRHFRDGLVENQKSKATLILGLDRVCQELGFVHYFPSYEFVLDDLRDYRFYEKDLSHPNEIAVDYIWGKFENVFFDEKTKNICRQVSQINNAAKHRPFHPSSEAHQSFLKKQIELINKLKKEHAFLDFQNEKNIFKKQLI